MKHISHFNQFFTESFNNIESTNEELYDLFIDFEDDGWVVKSKFALIVPDRNDWTGNFTSSKVRRIFGQEFIDFNYDVILSKGGKTWSVERVFIVNISNLHYIEELTNESIAEHWENLDKDINSRLSVIGKRANLLGFEILGVHGKWFQFGKASHSDFSNEPYFGWDCINDVISVAFVPIKIDEGLLDFFKKKKTELPTNLPNLLYEPIEVPYMLQYEENNHTISFTRSESDYIKGLVDPLLKTDNLVNNYAMYNSGPKFTSNHYKLNMDKVFLIRKYDDEWFIVTIWDKRIKEYEKYKYYKCDTFDGVKQLIANNT